MSPLVAALVAAHTAIAATLAAVVLSSRKRRRAQAARREALTGELAARTREIEHARIVASQAAERETARCHVAASIAREVSEPAVSILACLDQIRRRIDVDDDATRRALSECIDGLRRIQTIVLALQGLAETDDDPIVSVRLESVVEAALLVVVRSVPGGIEVRRRVEPIGVVDTRAATVMRIVTELAADAAESIPAGEKGHIAVFAHAEGEFAVIEVHDSAAIEHAAPDTDARRRRLDAVRDALRSLEGSLALSERTSAGLTRTARFRMPAAHAEPASTPAPRTEPARAKVLLIDDEPAMLRVLGRVIARSHDVFTARSTERALALIEEHGATLDLILCDVILSGTDGLALREGVAAKFPALADRFVFITGGGGDRALRSRLDATGMPLLEKPLEPDSLLAFIVARLALSQRGSGGAA